MAEGNAPDYNVHAKIKNTDYAGRVGAAWTNDDGSISVKLDNFVVLEGNPHLLMRLFPNERKQAPTQPFSGKPVRGHEPF